MMITKADLELTDEQIAVLDKDESILPLQIKHVLEVLRKHYKGLQDEISDDRDKPEWWLKVAYKVIADELYMLQSGDGYAD